MHVKFDQEYHFQIHHNKVAVLEWGDPQAEPILCLHGWLDNAATFHYLAPFLADKYRLIAIEFPGHGQSEHLSEDADYQFVSGISIIDGALDVLKIEKCHILGHSMGAALAMIYAGAAPHRVKSLISIDALGPFISTPEQTIEQLAQAIEQRKAKRSQKRYFNSIEDAANARAQVSELSAETLLPLIERGVTLCDRGYQWSSDARLKNASWIRMTEPQLEALMNNVTAEVLFIRGKQGMLQEKAAIEKRLSFLNSSEWIDLDGGHHLHMQYPEEVSQAILKFWAKFNQD
ncbi:alpha/beta fold hydrolase [Kangiella aquimarina]|uniref:Alpha/beta hydrolase n=1 Tax=Kangiella aquimarina TaxID=261965 RepID=A0ABZ0X1U9_9GAMM|nr:alpha/beta hydrolase [Kangiella aquimarina]WQG84354.1 alpha/beta hydrolase [Kangiella aquimarina]